MRKRIVHIVILLLTLLLCYWSFRIYSYVYLPNINLGNQPIIIYIDKQTDYKKLKEKLKKLNIIKNIASLDQLSKFKKGFKNNIKSGKYIISPNISNNEFINLLRSGSQVPITLTFNNLRNISQLASIVSKKTNCDSLSFYKAVYSKETFQTYNKNKYTISTLFIPDTYEVLWDFTPIQLINKFTESYNRFWNKENRKKAKNINLTPTQVSILASIVEEEQKKFIEELGTIAGLYINRLEKNIPLQSDPTIKFASKNFNIKRVLNKDKKIDSPYNTYKYKGLPPGPINLPSKNALEAVLNPDKHDYFYMCSKADFSGYHHFSKNLAQHLIYASKYKKFLNKNKIFR